MARALHEYGRRRKGPFVAINMAAIPRDLIEIRALRTRKRRLHRGAGAFLRAASSRRMGGTLFLDEIGDMPMEAQTRLLRVLQQGEYTTVGGRTPIRTDVRIVAATNKDPRTLIDQGLFREDLFYRLNVVPLRLPPLRERAEDIPDLVRHFFARAEQEGLQPKRIGSEGLNRLKNYRWPGNVRELENLVRRLAALYPQDEISAEIIEQELRAAGALRASQSEALPEEATLTQAVEQHLQRYFAQFGDQLPPAGLYQRVLADVEQAPFDRGADGDWRESAQGQRTFWGSTATTLRKKIRGLWHQHLSRRGLTCP